MLQEQILSVRLQARAQPAPRAVEAQRAAATAWLEQHFYLKETHGYNCAPLIDQLARANGNALQLALQMRLPALALLLASCATAQATLTTPTQLFTRAIDTPTAVVPISARGNYKFKRPVSITVQAGTGNVATPTVTGADKTGQHAQALTTGPGSPVTASSKKGSVPWWVLLLIGGLSLAGSGSSHHYLPEPSAYAAFAGFTRNLQQKSPSA